jgi:tRNA A58 N-methylase Trm61
VKVSSEQANGLEMPVMKDFERRVLAPTIMAALLALGARDVLALRSEPLPDVAGPADAFLAQNKAPDSPGHPLYETRANHDPDGTGKFYMDREIAQVMGPGGMDWLDRPEREAEEPPAKVLEALELRPGEVVADLGAGSGYFTFRMAPKVGPAGRVLAVEIQEPMLNALRARVAALKASNVQVIKGSETDPHLPVNGVDLVLLVDVYHELAYPFEVLSKVRDALKPDGHVVFVEYRKEDPKVQIKEVHKMSVVQLEREMRVAGFVRVRTVETLPLQHIVIFARQNQVGNWNSDRRATTQTKLTVLLSCSGSV